MAREIQIKVENKPLIFFGVPLLKSVEQMALLSGIAEKSLRILMDNGELEFVQNGNRRLLTD